MTKEINWETVLIDGIDYDDYPNFCNAYISYAKYKDGIELSEKELDQLTKESNDFINKYCRYLHITT